MKARDHACYDLCDRLNNGVLSVWREREMLVCDIVRSPGVLSPFDLSPFNYS